VIIAKNVDYISVEDIMHLFSIRLDGREEYRSVSIEYKVGIAETFGGNQTTRKLLAQALGRKKVFKSGADSAEETT
jgi:hypothetical protein